MAEVAIIVPVLGRPEHAATFMESLRANTPKTKYNVYPVNEWNDQETAEAWRAEGRLSPKRVHLCSRNDAHTFAEKVTAAYSWETGEPYVLLVGSDVVFKPHWFESAIKVADKTGAGLIATNDLGNPRVMAGRHATHPLISRRYIEEKGASWDGPGTIVHTGYRHNAVDDEWSTKALLDGEFAFARRSVIEHRHPIWGKGDMDWVYAKGQESFNEDVALFQRRVRQFTSLLDGIDA